MRIFVIMRPGLSVGPPGSTVSGEKLRMSDDKLDAFVEAGYAVEIHGASEDREPRVDTIPDVDLSSLGPPPKPRARKAR